MSAQINHRRLERPRKLHREIVETRMGTIRTGRILDELTAEWKQLSIRQILIDEKHRSLSKAPWIVDQCVYIYSVSRGIKKVSRDSLRGWRKVIRWKTNAFGGPRVRDGDGRGNSRNFRGDRGNLKEILARLWAWDTVTMGEIEFIKVEREWGIKCWRNTIWRGREGGDIKVEDGWNRWSETFEGY